MKNLEDYSLTEEGEFGVINILKRLRGFLSELRNCIPDAKNFTQGQLSEMYPSVYPEELFSKEIFDIFENKMPFFLSKFPF